jgi:hypothetical protein
MSADISRKPLAQNKKAKEPSARAAKKFRVAEQVFPGPFESKKSYCSGFSATGHIALVSAAVAPVAS